MKRKSILIALFIVSLLSAIGQKKDKVIVIKSDQNNAEYLYNDAVKSYNEKNFSEAIEQLQLSIKENDTLPAPHFLLGVIHREMNKKQISIQSFLKYIELSTIKDTAFYIIAQIYNEENKPDSALMFLKSCTDHNPNFCQAHYLKGVINFEKSYYDEAIHHFSKAIEINSENSDVYNDRGSTYRLLEKYEDALNDYDKAIVLNKKAIYYNNRGSLKVKMEKFDEAIDDYTSAIVLDSNYYLAINNRGMAKLGIKDYTGAIHDFNLCLEKNKDYYASISNRGIAYYKIKKYKEAIEDFDYILTINPSDASTYLHRGNTKEMIRDNEGACQDWQKAAELGIEEAKKYIKNQCEN